MCRGPALPLGSHGRCPTGAALRGAAPLSRRRLLQINLRLRGARNVASIDCFIPSLFKSATIPVKIVDPFHRGCKVGRVGSTAEPFSFLDGTLGLMQKDRRSIIRRDTLCSVNAEVARTSATMHSEAHAIQVRSSLSATMRRVRRSRRASMATTCDCRSGPGGSARLA